MRIRTILFSLLVLVVFSVGLTLANVATLEARQADPPTGAAVDPQKRRCRWTKW